MLFAIGNRVLRHICTKNRAPVLAQNTLIRVIVLFCANLEGINSMLYIKISEEEREMLEKTNECFTNMEGSFGDSKQKRITT